MERMLNVKFDATLQEDLTFGSLDSNGKWNGMILKLLRNESDIAGPFFINEERASVVDFSAPIGFSQLAVMSGLVPANREPLLILKIFTLQVWLFIMVSTLTAAGAAAFIYMLFPLSLSPKKMKREVFAKYVWMFYGTLLGKEFGSSSRWYLKHVLAAGSFRLLISVWILGPALVVMYTYQGAITSTFAADKLKPKIQTIEELHQSTDVLASTYKNSFPYSCLKHLKGTNLEPLIGRVEQNLKKPPVNVVPEWLEDVEEGKLAFIAELVTMKAMLADRFRHKGRCGIYISPIDLCPAYISFAYRENYRPKLQQKFNKRFLWYSEGRLYQRRMLSSLADYEMCTRISSNAVKPLKMKDLFGAFFIYCVGVCFSLSMFLGEMVIEYTRKTTLDINKNQNTGQEQK